MRDKWTYPEKVQKLKFTERHQQGVLRNLGTRQKKRYSKKVFFSGLATAVLVIMLSLSVLFVPAMENVLAKIPFISQFIDESEKRMEKTSLIFEEIELIVKDHGLDVGNIQLSHESKELKVFVSDLPDNTASISERIQASLEEKEFTGYKVEVLQHEERRVETNEQSEKNIRDSKTLERDVTERLRAEGYELMFPVQVRINEVEGIFMSVIVPESEKRLEHLEKIMKEEAKVYGDQFKLDIRQVQKIAREQEKRWGKTGAIGNIGSALMKSDQWPVTGFSFSFHPYPLIIKVKTSLEPNDPEAIKVANEIRDEIELFINTDETTETIRDDEYNLKILNKDKKEIK